MASHSTSPFLILLTTLFLTFPSSSSSDSIFPASSISAAPLSLSSSSPPPAFSPSVAPLFPTSPQLSPAESSLPIIPSTPSPPKPDDDAMAAQGPVMAVAPSRFSMDSSSLRAMSGGRGFSSVVVVCGLVVIGLVWFDVDLCG